MANVYNKPIVVIGGGGGSGEDRLKALFDLKKTCYYEFYGLKNLTFEELGNLLRFDDTSNVTNMSYMFTYSSNLTTIPAIDTSNVKDMSYMFTNCRKLISIPQLNTSNVTNMTFMFSECDNLTTIPAIDTSNVTNMARMFNGCSNLTTIPAIDVSNVTNMNFMFAGCSKLENILMYGMKVKFDISASTKFTHEALVTILNNLATVTSRVTLIMGETNLTKLTEADKAIANNKGWTLS